MNTITRFIQWLFDNGYGIAWEDSSKGDGITWQVTAEGKLLFNHRDMTPLHPMSKEQLEQSLQNILAKIRFSGCPIILKGIAIEEHIATGLWNQGVITKAILQAGKNYSQWLEISLELLAAQYPVRIVRFTYYEEYEFIVDGHPQGLVRVRDIPDALAALGRGEETF